MYRILAEINNKTSYQFCLLMEHWKISISNKKKNFFFIFLSKNYKHKE